jgi:hypothetical protein
MTVHGSFVEWVKKDVMPLKKKNPTWYRLDGKTDGGNRAVVVSSDTLGGSGWFMEIHTLIRFSVLASRR